MAVRNTAQTHVDQMEARISELEEALRMISAETKESNEPIGRSVFKALATCGEIADLALLTPLRSEDQPERRAYVERTV